MGQLKVVLPYDNWLTVVNVTGEVWNSAALNKLELNRIRIGDPTLTPTFVNEFSPWFVQQLFGGHYLKQVLWIENDHEGKPKTVIPRRMIRKRTSLIHTIKTAVLKQKLEVPVLKENCQADKKTREMRKKGKHVLYFPKFATLFGFIKNFLYMEQLDSKVEQHCFHIEISKWR